MYAHPSFVRDQPETLSQLRKVNTASGRRRVSDKTSKAEKLAAARSVSPSPTRMLVADFRAPMARISNNHATSMNLASNFSQKQQTPTWAPIHHRIPNSPEQKSSSLMEQAIPKRTASRGRLDLLAFAMEQCESAAAQQ